MALYIKDAATHELARQLARETGESLSSAVRTAIQERLARFRGQRERRARESGAIVARLPISARTSRELVEELYDPETGLPI
jgi:antitoxin VapB